MHSSICSAESRIKLLERQISAHREELGSVRARVNRLEVAIEVVQSQFKIGRLPTAVPEAKQVQNNASVDAKAQKGQDPEALFIKVYSCLTDLWSSLCSPQDLLLYDVKGAWHDYFAPIFDVVRE